MIRVVKVLNNSVVLAVEEPGGEVILMGKGIGFGKSIGQQISPKEGGAGLCPPGPAVEPEHPAAGGPDR